MRGHGMECGRWKVSRWIQVVVYEKETKATTSPGRRIARMVAWLVQTGQANAVGGRAVVAEPGCLWVEGGELVRAPGAANAVRSRVWGYPA